MSNGTAALHTILAALDVGPGDEVILPSLTFISTANAVLYQGATPVLVECDPDTFNVTPEIIEAAVTPRTKAIVPVDMNGLPVGLRRHPRAGGTPRHTRGGRQRREPWRGVQGAQGGRHRAAAPVQFLPQQVRHHGPKAA